MKKLRVIVFHVDHGFCAFAKSPNGYALLIDCGATEKFSPIKYISENELSDTVQYNGHKLAKFILTHPHDDHLSDIERVKSLLRPGIMLRQKYDWDDVKTGDRGEYENLDTYVDLQQDYNQPVTSPPDWGMNISHGDYLTPEKAKEINENEFINNSSIPTFIEYKGYKIVLPGDLEADAWTELFKREAFKDSIKAGNFFVTSHHGHSSGYCKEIYGYMGKPFFNIISTHSGDESVESAYSKPENAIGITHNGETRYMLSTRSDGSIVIEIYENGKVTFDCVKLTDNLGAKAYSFY